MDFSEIDGKAQEVFVDATQTKTFTFSTCGGAPIIYQLFLFSGSATPNLISLPDSTQPNIRFAQSLSLSDVKTYYLWIDVTIPSAPALTYTWFQA
jgi:hypothetical protein